MEQQHIAVAVIGVIISDTQVAQGKIQIAGVSVLQHIGHQVVQRLLIVQEAADVQHAADDCVVVHQPLADLLMLMAADSQRQRRLQRFRHMDDCAVVLAGDGAPKPAHQRFSGGGFFPVDEFRRAAKADQAFHQHVLLDAQQRSFRCQAAQHLRTQLLAGVEFVQLGVLLRVVGALPDFLRAQLVCQVKYSDFRQCQEALVAGFQLLLPDDAHGFVCPVQPLDIGFAQHGIPPFSAKSRLILSHILLYGWIRVCQGLQVVSWTGNSSHICKKRRMHEASSRDIKFHPAIRPG